MRPKTHITISFLKASINKPELNLWFSFLKLKLVMKTIMFPSHNDIQTPVILKSCAVCAIVRSLDSFMQCSGCTFC